MHHPSAPSMPGASRTQAVIPTTFPGALGCSPRPIPTFESHRAAAFAERQSGF
jgi:hypothetical protein